LCSSISWVWSNPITPEAWLQYHRDLRDIGSIILLVGVIAEIVIDEFWEASHPPLLRGRKATTLFKTKAARWKRYSMLFAGLVLVGGGIAMEWWQGKAADDVSDEIRTNLQTELVEVSPRPGLLYGKRREDLISNIRQFAGQRAEIRFCRHLPIDKEEWSTAVLIQVAVRGAKWTIPPFATEDDCSGEGIAAYISSRASPRTREAAERLVSSLAKVPLVANLSSASLEATGVPPPPDGNVNTVVLIVYDHPLFVKGIL
jgi:hypothetical protein